MASGAHVWKPLGSGFDEKFQTRIRDCLALCSGKDSKIITKSADKDSISAKGDSVKYQGNPTECALLGFADQCKFVKKDIYTWRDEDMKKEKKDGKETREGEEIRGESEAGRIEESTSWGH